MEIIYVDQGLSDEDTDDIALAYKRSLKDLEELKAYVEMLKAELANRSLDQPRKILTTSYGTFKGRWAPGYRKWDRDGLAKQVFELARKGELHKPDAFGELPGTVESRVMDAIQRVFLLEPRIGQIRAASLDPDEYSTVEGEGKWTVSPMKEKD